MRDTRKVNLNQSKNVIEWDTIIAYLLLILLVVCVLPGLLLIIASVVTGNIY